MLVIQSANVFAVRFYTGNHGLSVVFCVLGIIVGAFFFTFILLLIGFIMWIIA